MARMQTESKPENMQKYENYKEQFKRLNRAINQCFYLEAMFIAYAIMEDRTESILRHAGKWEIYLKKRNGYNPTIDSKIRYIQKQAEQKKTLMNKYFSDDLLDEILTWKDERNRMIHALMKQPLTTKMLEDIALQGKNLARALTNISGSFNKAAERKARNEKMIIRKG